MSATASSTPQHSSFKARAASAKRVTVRCAIIASPGAGKTYGALVFACGLVGPKAHERRTDLFLDDLVDGKRVGRARIAVIDTQSEQSDNYSATIGFPYDVIPFDPPHSPERSQEVLLYAAGLRYDAVIFDSLSHEWEGEGGVMMQVDESEEKNKFFAWRGPSKAHKALLQSVVASPIDVICTIRTKIAYEIVDQGGKKVPKRIGLAPIQRPGTEYEFDLVLGVDQQTHEAEIQKCNAGYHGVVLEALAKNPQISKDLGAKIAAWRASLPEAPITVAASAPTTTVTSTPANGAPGTVAARVATTSTTPAPTPAATPTPPAATTPPAASTPPAGTATGAPAEKPKRTRAKRAGAAAETPPAPAAPPPTETPFESYQLTGTKCAACNEPQRKTPAGPRCLHGHDALPVTPSGNGVAADSLPPSGSAAGSPATPSGGSNDRNASGNVNGATASTPTPAPSTSPTPSGTPPPSPTGAPVTTAETVMDDSVYDIAEVPIALAAEVKAVKLNQELPVTTWKSLHAWLLVFVGGDKAAAMEAWKKAGCVAGGPIPNGKNAQDLVFHVAGIKMTNPKPATAGK